VIETDNQSQAMLEFLQKEVETAIRDLSICILAPKIPSSAWMIKSIASTTWSCIFSNYKKP